MLVHLLPLHRLRYCPWPLLGVGCGCGSPPLRCFQLSLSMEVLVACDSLQFLVTRAGGRSKYRLADSNHSLSEGRPLRRSNSTILLGYSASRNMLRSAI